MATKRHDSTVQLTIRLRKHEYEALQVYTRELNARWPGTFPSTEDSTAAALVVLGLERAAALAVSEPVEGEPVGGGSAL